MKIIEAIKKDVADKVSGRKVLLGVSGGVDSLSLALILSEVIGKNLLCLYMHSGLDRSDDRKRLIEFFKMKGIDLKIFDIRKAIIKNLANKITPTDKKDQIKKIFIQSFKAYAEQVGADFIAHGTNRDDRQLLFENHGGHIKNTSIKNLEPFIKLCKDDIGKIAHFLGLYKNRISKYPLSSWGMSRRIVGEISSKKLQAVRQLDRAFLALLEEKRIDSKLKNAAVYLCPDFSRKGEKYFIVLKAVAKNNQPAKLPGNFLECISKNLLNENSNISRVVYEITTSNELVSEWD